MRISIIDALKAAGSARLRKCRVSELRNAAATLPDFRALHFHNDVGVLCVWCFDLLHLDGKDLRALPLTERKATLERLIYKARDNRLRFSETFDDGAKLLASCDRMSLEGIVSKRADAPYRSGPTKDWIKVKCAAWREANKDRHELFKKKPTRR